MHLISIFCSFTKCCKPNTFALRRNFYEYCFFASVNTTDKQTTKTTNALENVYFTAILFNPSASFIVGVTRYIVYAYTGTFHALHTFNEKYNKIRNCRFLENQIALYTAPNQQGVPAISVPFNCVSNSAVLVSFGLHPSK